MRKVVKHPAKPVSQPVSAAVKRVGEKAAAAGLSGLDGRATRWDGHRAARRNELVEAAVAAIDRHGPAASIAEIAASAGVSKPVLYRYFADKDDLHRAVGQWGAEQVVATLTPVLVSREPIRDKSYRAGAEYLALIEQHPQVFLLLVEHRSAQDPLADGKELVAASIARYLGDLLRALNVDAGGAEPWAHGLVGLGLSVGEWWLRRKTMNREAAAQYLGSFVWHAFEGIAGEQGVELDDDGRLRLVAEGAP